MQKKYGNEDIVVIKQGVENMKQGVPFVRRIITLTKYKDLFQKVKFMLTGNTTQNKDTKKESSTFLG